MVYQIGLLLSQEHSCFVHIILVWDLAYERWCYLLRSLWSNVSMFWTFSLEPSIGYKYSTRAFILYRYLLPVSRKIILKCVRKFSSKPPCIALTTFLWITQHSLPCTSLEQFLLRTLKLPYRMNLHQYLLDIKHFFS